MADVVGVVLAAGSGSRMGTPKAVLELDGTRLVDRAIAAMADGGCSPVVVVGREGLVVDGAVLAVNSDPERGMRSSLHLGVAAAIDNAPTADAIAVLLVDTPGITAAEVGAVVGEWRVGRIAMGRYGTRRSHPTVMAPARWLEALQLAGPDEGARALLAAHPELVDEIPVLGDPTDLDTPDDLARWHDAPG